MKKLLLTASLLLGFCGLVKADVFDVPQANTMQQANIGYGGIKVATSSFTSFLTTVTFSTTTSNDLLGWTVYGVNFTTGTCGDFVDVFDSTAAALVLNTTNVPRHRLYNVYNSTSQNSLAGAFSCSGFSGFVGQTGTPIRINQRPWFRSNSDDYNGINLYYWKPE